MLAIEPLHPRYGARLHGVDMRAPISDETFARIKVALATHAVCVIGHDAPPANEAHIAFSAWLGPLQRSAQKIASTGERVQYPEIVDQSNLDEVGETYADDDRRLAYKRANRLWHRDMSFYDVRATYSLLAAHAIPPQGAEIEFTDMRAVWDALPESLRRAMRSPMSTRRPDAPRFTSPRMCAASSARRRSGRAGCLMIS